MKNENLSLKQNEILFCLKKRIENTYLNYDNMHLIILSKDKIAKELLSLLDNVNRELNNSIKFGDFHRGVKYLILMKMICEKIFSNEKIADYKRRIDNYMRM